MQFMIFLSLLQKRGLSYAIYRISFPSSKTWTIICNFLNFFLFSKNMDYHMQVVEFFLFYNNVDYHMQFLKFLSLLQKHGQSYAISGISFPSTNFLTIICNFCNFFSFS